MPEALPTPYDITGLPVFAYEPGWQDWLLLVLLGAATLFALSIIARRSRRRGSVEAFSFALSELMALRRPGDSTLSKDKIARASLIVKRLVSNLHSAPIAQFSSNELRRYLAEVHDQGARDLLERVIALEEFKFRPDDRGLPSADELGRLIEMVERLQREAGGNK